MSSHPVRARFAFETTLSSRSFAPWLTDLKASGYAVHIVFLWLSSAELALERVAERVALGGHDVPAVTVRAGFPSRPAKIGGLRPRIRRLVFNLNPLGSQVLTRSPKGRPDRVRACG